MDSWDKFDEEKLPPGKMWYSKLKDSDVSVKEYQHAQKVWQTFNCQTLGDYSDLYCRTDVLLLANVFEKFRTTCARAYKLDPANYFTSFVYRGTLCSERQKYSSSCLLIMIRICL